MPEGVLDVVNVDLLVLKDVLLGRATRNLEAHLRKLRDVLRLKKGDDLACLAGGARIG